MHCTVLCPCCMASIVVGSQLLHLALLSSVIIMKEKAIAHLIWSLLVTTGEKFWFIPLSNSTYSFNVITDQKKST